MINLFAIKEPAPTAGSRSSIKTTFPAMWPSSWTATAVGQAQNAAHGGHRAGADTLKRIVIADELALNRRSMLFRRKRPEEKFLYHEADENQPYLLSSSRNSNVQLHIIGDRTRSPNRRKPLRRLKPTTWPPIRAWSRTSPSPWRSPLEMASRPPAAC